MKNIVIIIVLALIGAGAAFGYLKWKSSSSPQTAQPAGGQRDQGRPAAGAAVDADAHGAEVSLAEGDVLCAKHRIPQSKDAFCHPELVEQLGFCGEHDVPEAFCTRCSPVLIVAFKAAGDWCQEHNLPESQCAICKGETGG